MKLVKHVASEFADRMWLFWHDIKHIPRNIKDGITNMWKWRHIIWNDRDWDYTFTYDVLEFKLRKQMRYMKARNHYTSTQRSVEKMELACELINRVRNEYYIDERFDYYDTEVDLVPTEIDGRLVYDFELVLVWEKYDDYLALYPRKAKLYAHSDKEAATMGISYGNHEQAHRILHKLIEQNIQQWWH